MKESLAGLRQRRVVRVLDLTKMNKRSLDEMVPDDEADDELLDPVLRQQQQQGDDEPPQGPASVQPSGFDEAPPVHDDRASAQNPPENTPAPSQLEIERAQHNDALWRQFPVSPNVIPDPSNLPPVPMNDEEYEPEQPMEPPPLPPVPEDDDLLTPVHIPPSLAPTEPEPDVEIDPLYRTPKAETFDQKRARLNRQETLWMKKSAPHDTSQPHSTARGSDDPLPMGIPGVHRPPTPDSGSTRHQDKKPRTEEFNEESFHVELLSTKDDKNVRSSLNDLAEGWTYDEKTQEFTLGPTTDYWG